MFRSSSHRRPALATLAGAAVLASLVVAAPPAASKSPNTVDPGTMTPALSPEFAPWSCFEAGQGITCQGSFEDAYSFAIGLQCDGRDVWLSGTSRERMTRWHTQEGLATKAIVHLDYPEDVFSFSPTGAGPRLVVSGHWGRHYTYGTPGDPATRVLTERGLIYLGKDDGSVVFRDMGTVTFEPGHDYESVAEMHGVHAMYSDPTVIDRLICDALT